MEKDSVNFVYRNKNISINIIDKKEYIGNYINHNKNFYEIELLEQIYSLNKNHNTILDIGSNIGNHVVYFENFISYKKMFCFEPQKLNYEKLCSNIYRSDTVAFNVALSDSFGKGSLVKKEEFNSGTYQLVGGKEVDVLPLDYFNFKDVTLLKIDVEGHELRVLNGALNTIKTCKPIIYMEVADEEASDLLIEIGYKKDFVFWYGPSPTYRFVI